MEGVTERYIEILEKHIRDLEDALAILAEENEMLINKSLELREANREEYLRGWKQGASQVAK